MTVHRPLDPNTGQPLPLVQQKGGVSKGHATPQIDQKASAKKKDAANSKDNGKKEEK